MKPAPIPHPTLSGRKVVVEVRILFKPGKGWVASISDARADIELGHGDPMPTFASSADLARRPLEAPA